MSKVTSFSFICVLSLVVRSTHGANSKPQDLSLQSKIIATAFTGFDENDKLDISVIPQIAQYYKDNKISVVYVSAYYGGGPSLTLDERKSLVSTWAEQSNNLGFDLIVEIGGQSFIEVLEFAQFCSQKNVSALTAFAEMVYQPAVPSEMVEDMQRICDAASDLPLFYHDFAVVDQEVDPIQTYLSACNKVSCFAGVIASIDALTLLRASAPNATDCQFWVETSDQTAPGLILQMDAAASPAVNLCPGLALDIEKAVNANDPIKALQLQEQMNSFVADLTNYDGGVLDYTSRGYIENLKTAFYMKTDIKLRERDPLEPPNSTVIEKLSTGIKNPNCY